jgi:2-keto-4-pentenoate hydratase
MDFETIVDAFWQSACGAPLESARLNGALSLETAARVQLAVLDRHVTAGERLGGWKVGLTSGRSRDAFGPGVRPFGYILQRRIFPSGTRLPLAPIRRCGVENELCFALDAPLAGAATTADEARAAVGAVAPAFEVNEVRLDDAADNGVRLADDLSQWGLVVGEWQRPGWHKVDWASVEVALARDGREVERQVARGHIDDHFASIAALTRSLAAVGRGLRAGDRVITGAFTRQAVDAPSRWAGRFDVFGSVTVEFA